ncbi:MAG: TetR/AcrR family transcriptional regulator [Lachnospiraceae bacterium]|nr:TetR/AcrR family transcriptional regulator [Lachnospiraceae bacterium]
MPRDKSVNHIKIMSAAREEFMEKGFEKASMRGIASRCGMTAAGIYRHCTDKEDLFHQIVAPAENMMKEWAKEHIHRYKEPVRKGSKITWQDSHIDMMREIIYPNMEDYHLLIACSKGSRYENYLHDITEESQKRFISYLNEMRKGGYRVPEITPIQIHMLLTAYISALFEPVIHNYSYEDAVSALATLEIFFMPGWRQLMKL